MLCLQVFWLSLFTVLQVFWLCLFTIYLFGFKSFIYLCIAWSSMFISYGENYILQAHCKLKFCRRQIEKMDPQNGGGGGLKRGGDFFET